MELVLRTYELPLRHEFRISRGSRTSQRTMIVDLSLGECHGYGEATESSYYQASLTDLQQSIEAVRHILANDNAENPHELWDRLRPELASQPFALCAIDEAAWDLHGKLVGKPLYQIWGQSIEKVPASNYTLGIDSLDGMLAKLREMPDWPIYKIKLGTPYDLEIVQYLRKHTSALFRVDANGGWSLEQAFALIPKLAKLGVEFVEQPLACGLWEEQRELFLKSPLPLIADESCLMETDVARCENHFHGINIKLVKCGGITPARRMIANAHARQLSVMVGCMTESTVGISAIAQLLPQLDFVDMDGAVLLAADIANGAWIHRGICHFPPGPGSGIMLRADSLNYEISPKSSRGNIS